MDKIPEEHNPMEEVVQDLLTYLRHQQTEVRKKALEALFSYSGDPTVQRAIQHQDFVKAIKACLYDVKLVHTTLLLLLNASAEKDIVKAFEEVNMVDSLMQIIVNVMKTMNKEDLILKKHLMVEVGDTKIGPGGELIRELKVNSGEKLSEDEVVAVMNIENLRLALLIISNMCILSIDSKKQILQLNHPDPKVHGTHFIVLLGWFLIDEYELLFEGFSSLVNSLSEGDDFKEFLLGKTVRLETRIKRYLLHENNVIRSNMMMCMKNLTFAYDNPDFSDRFCVFQEDEVHIIEIVSRALYTALKKKYEVKPKHLEIMDSVLGTVWKTIKTLKHNNPKLLSVEDEIEHCLDILLCTTNFDFSKYFPDGTADFDQVKQMKKTLAMFLEYGVEVYLRDKVTAITHIYTGEMLM